MVQPNLLNHVWDRLLDGAVGRFIQTTRAMDLLIPVPQAHERLDCQRLLLSYKKPQ